MGNCLKSDKARVQNEEQLEVAKAASREVEERKRMREFEDGKGKKKKMEKFRLTGEGTNAVEREKEEVLRIKVLVTLEELKQILNCDDSELKLSSVEKLVTAMKLRKQILNCDDSDLKQSSVEKLVTAMKLRGRRIYEVRTNDNVDSNSSWRPALESIPEDH